jgi:hypothetical protein
MFSGGGGGGTSEVRTGLSAVASFAAFRGEESIGGGAKE